MTKLHRASVIHQAMNGGKEDEIRDFTGPPPKMKKGRGKSYDLLAKAKTLAFILIDKKLLEGSGQRSDIM